MRKIIFILYFLPLILFSQEFKPLIQTPYYDWSSGIFLLENEEILVPHFIPGFNENTFEIYHSDSINGNPFSTLLVYDKYGLNIKAITLPDTDSTIYSSSFLTQLKDGRFCIAGEAINPYTEHRNLFYSIVNHSISTIEILKIIPSSISTECERVFEMENGNLAFIVNENGGKIKEYNTSGTFVSEILFNNLPCIPGDLSWSRFLLNDELKHICKTTLSNLLISTSFTTGNTTTNIPLVSEMNNRRIEYTARSGTNFKDNLLINAAAGYNTNDLSPLIFHLDTQNNISTFFSDTNSVLSNDIFRYFTNTTYFDEDYIYAIFKDNRSVSGSYVLYCLTKTGNLRWKKFIDLDSNLSSNYSKGNVLTNIATLDKGFMFALLIDDNYGHSDVYYYKIDSLGNPSDFETGIFSFGPKLEINDFALFPNPIQNKLNIETALKGNFKLNVFDVLGKRITTYAFENSATLNVEKLNQGTYFYTISNQEDKQLQEGKFLKE